MIPSSAIIAEPVIIGPFFVGNNAPDIQAVLLWDSGGYVDLTGAAVTFSVQRWDPVRERRYGPMKAGGGCAFAAVQFGEAIFSWAVASKSIVSSTNTVPIVLNVTVHGYTTGALVTVAGHDVNTNANGTWVVTYVGPNNFSLNGSVGNGTGGATGTVTPVAGSVPATPGWYAGRFIVTFADNKKQESQDLLFEVREAAAIS